MTKARWLDEECSICGARLNSWDARLSKALTYESPVCEKCMADEYGMDVDRMRAYFEEIFGMRPCTGL